VSQCKKEILNMAEITEIVRYCDTLLESGRFHDYCPNGLQVEGWGEVLRIVSGVTASRALIEQAIAQEANMLLVHHGYFWKGEDARIVGMKRGRISMLLEHGINLVAYHLPLDAHPELGNNAQLALRLGLQTQGSFGGNGDPDIGLFGTTASAVSGAEFARQMAAALGREPLHIAGTQRPVSRVAWCTGAAQNYIEQAARLGVDAFITGEVSEHTVHVARECDLHFYAAGHHATERYGVQALGDRLAREFDVRHSFIDIDNPV
jgi:dinuclear metal center YbgI/SA1388 family protein